MKSMKYWLTCAAMLLMAQVALAQDAIEITRGTDRATPVAVVPFGWQGGAPLPEDLAQITSDNLRNSGMFAPFARENMLSYPTSAEEIFPRDWKMLGVEYVIAGRISSSEISNSRISGSASSNCEPMSGGVITAATMKMPTIT